LDGFQIKPKSNPNQYTPPLPPRLGKKTQKNRNQSNFYNFEVRPLKKIKGVRGRIK
jgi:hypothetical protein